MLVLTHPDASGGNRWSDPVRNPPKQSSNSFAPNDQKLADYFNTPAPGHKGVDYTPAHINHANAAPVSSHRSAREREHMLSLCWSLLAVSVAWTVYCEAPSLCCHSLFLAVLPLTLTVLSLTLTVLSLTLTVLSLTLYCASLSGLHTSAQQPRQRRSSELPPQCAREREHCASLSHTPTITCTCCYDEIKGIQDQDFSCSLSDSLSHTLTHSGCAL